MIDDRNLKVPRNRFARRFTRISSWVAVHVFRKRPWTDVATALAAIVVATITVLAALVGRQALLERQLRARLVYVYPYAEQGGAAVFAVLDVRNGNMPTSLEPHSWHMHVAVQGQDRESGASSPSGFFILRIRLDGNCKDLAYPESQTIYARGESMIETGGVVTGFMLGSFPGLNLNDIDVTTVRITFDDAFGKTHETDKIGDIKAVSTFLKTPDLGQSLTDKCK